MAIMNGLKTKCHPLKDVLHEMLKIDKNFVPASEDDGDELYPNGIFVFNITKMLKYINDNRDMVPLTNIDVKAYRNGFSSLNESHIDSVDVTSPVILAEISPGRYNIIDGNHRLEKAYRTGMKNIPAYMLSPKQHIPFLTSVRAYHAYVEYWNAKIKDRERLRKEERRLTIIMAANSARPEL